MYSMSMRFFGITKDGEMTALASRLPFFLEQYDGLTAVAAAADPGLAQNLRF
jgi:hypothetical protein